MKETKEIAALLQLIDDPDEEVYHSVRKKLISFGKEVIPNLEDIWETTADPVIQERVELLIHGVQYEDVKQKFAQWITLDNPDLLSGACILNSYHFPELSVSNIAQQIEKLRRNIWLELNPYLTPLEQTNVLTGIIFQYCHFTQKSLDYNRPTDFLLAPLLETKKGNSLILTILQLILADLSEIPLKLLQIPGQLILGYVKKEEKFSEQNEPEHIPFFIDGGSGQIFSYSDIMKYLKTNELSWEASYFESLTNQEIIAILIEQYASCFDNDHTNYKRAELIKLATMLRAEI
ncbi:MAG: transglutaminase family protein [Bacteroidota bacterium]|jgi:hypothetical protein